MVGGRTLFLCYAAQYSNHVGVGRRKIYNYRLNNAGSGLTHYNVTMGTNALWNTKNIGDKLVIRTNSFKMPLIIIFGVIIILYLNSL